MQREQRQHRLRGRVAERGERGDAAGLVGAEAHEARHGQGRRTLAGDQRHDHLARRCPREQPEARAGHGQERRVQPGVLAEAQPERERERRGSTPEARMASISSAIVRGSRRRGARGAAAERRGSLPARPAASRSPLKITHASAATSRQQERGTLQAAGRRPRPTPARSAARTTSSAAKSRNTAIPSDERHAAHAHAVAPVQQGDVAQLAEPGRQQVDEHVAGGGHQGDRDPPGNRGSPLPRNRRR